MKAARRRRDAARDAFAGRRVPRPPAELAERVLAAARLAAMADDGDRGWIDRVWESRATRWLWTLTACGLVLAHLALARAPDAGAPALPRPAAIEELAPVVPPALQLTLARRGGDGRVDRQRQLALLLAGEAAGSTGAAAEARPGARG